MQKFSKNKIEIIETDINAENGQYKCPSCGAEVIIDTSEVTYARCHWCRNTLSINQQISNGAIPDAVLPFKVTKDEAKKEIENFIKWRKFFCELKI